jgi:hypothetical protein
MAVFNQEKGGSGSTPEATLFKQAQAGCMDSLNTLMQKHEGLVHRVVQQQVLLGERLDSQSAVQTRVGCQWWLLSIITGKNTLRIGPGTTSTG